MQAQHANAARGTAASSCHVPASRGTNVFSPPTPVDFCLQRTKEGRAMQGQAEDMPPSAFTAGRHHHPTIHPSPKGRLLSTYRAAVEVHGQCVSPCLAPREKRRIGPVSSSSLQHLLFFPFQRHAMLEAGYGTVQWTPLDFPRDVPRTSLGKRRLPFSGELLECSVFLGGEAPPIIGLMPPWQKHVFSFRALQAPLRTQPKDSSPLCNSSRKRAPRRHGEPPAGEELLCLQQHRLSL